MAVKRPAAIPNFTATNEQIYIRDPSSLQPNSPDDPDLILLFAWGDGLPKHVAKYAEGFSTLYPAARQILILGPISKVFFVGLARRVEYMAPVIEALKDYVNPVAAKRSKIMVQVMSNTGGSNFASMLQAYRDKYAQPFPADLLIHDSTPGSPEFSVARMKNWSRGLSVGLSKFFPWPEIVTRLLLAFALTAMYVVGWLSGEEPAGVFAVRVLDDPTYLSTDMKKAYLYSKEDDLISWEDIEGYEAHARKLGYETKAVLFEGSPHVGHMRQHPQQYWGAIKDAWQWTIRG